ncbi:hypothetical protein Aph01nite_21940 [Acrocarpospora phusangensis]|uniref:PIN domain-containing protein n=1 Tax=Acrocarpospora phusangensis TaxID=1070424 RepID=A0A919UJA6_9ACTN|nr:hypothetical protein Aph01nite_21940 [Acrocarpospora phusangensis]
MARVFVDTNVLFPFSLMDLMLALTEDAVHTVVWSDHLLDEWERVIVREEHRSASSAARICAVIRGSSRTLASLRATTKPLSRRWRATTPTIDITWPPPSPAELRAS